MQDIERIREMSSSNDIQGSIAKMIGDESAKGKYKLTLPKRNFRDTKGAKALFKILKYLGYSVTFTESVCEDSRECIYTDRRTTFEMCDMVTISWY